MLMSPCPPAGTAPALQRAVVAQFVVTGGWAVEPKEASLFQSLTANAGVTKSAATPPSSARRNFLAILATYFFRVPTSLSAFPWAERPIKTAQTLTLKPRCRLFSANLFQPSQLCRYPHVRKPGGARAGDARRFLSRRERATSGCLAQARR